MKNKLGFTIKTVLTILLCIVLAFGLWVIAKL